MITRLLTALVWTVAAEAQIVVYTMEGGVETPVQGAIDLGSVPVGDLAEKQIRLWNRGSATVTLHSIRVAGAGFTIQNDPSKPYLMAAGTNVAFRVRFQPAAYGSYSATLTINEQTFIVTGVAPRGITIVSEDGTPLQSTALVQFGRVEVGQTATRRFLLRNATALPLTVGSILVSPPPFSGPLDIVLPAEIPPGTTASFSVQFAPLRSGVPTGLLSVDGRVFPLEGVALDPPFPTAIVSLDSAQLESGVQGKLRVTLSAASPVTGTGTLAMTFQPRVTGVEDSAIQFLANGTRRVTLTVAKGEDVARVDGQPDILFQTGTTAGEITVQLDLGFQQVRVPISLSSAPVRLDAVRVQRTSTGVELSAEGFDNTRTVTHASFTFYDRSGQPLPGNPFRISVADAFSGWWKRSGLGGLFLMRAAFPVAGDATQLSAVLLELENSLGKTASSRITF
jgi:hypothetical protein